MNSIFQYFNAISFIKIKLIASVTVFIYQFRIANCILISLFKVLLIGGLFYVIIRILTFCTVFTKQIPVDELIAVKGSAIADFNINSLVLTYHLSSQKLLRFKLRT